jgi:hypothetical protein
MVLLLSCWGSVFVHGSLYTRFIYAGLQLLLNRFCVYAVSSQVFIPYKAIIISQDVGDCDQKVLSIKLLFSRTIQPQEGGMGVSIIVSISKFPVTHHIFIVEIVFV